jgi:hypothetical protein
MVNVMRSASKVLIFAVGAIAILLIAGFLIRYNNAPNTVERELRSNKGIASVEKVKYFDAVLDIEATLADGRVLSISVVPNQLRDKPIYIALERMGNIEVICATKDSNKYAYNHGWFNIADLMRKNGITVNSITDFLVGVDRAGDLVMSLPEDAAKAVEVSFETVREGSAMVAPTTTAKCYRKLA